MSYSTNAYLFFGVTIDLPESVEWETLDDDTSDGIKIIRYCSDGDSMYTVAIHASVASVDLDGVAYAVTTESNVAWPARVKAFCGKHGLTCGAPMWRMCVSRF